MTSEALSLAALESCPQCGRALGERPVGEYCCAGCKAASEWVAQGKFGAFAHLDQPDFIREFSGDGGATMRFYLEGVHCAACVSATEGLAGRVPGLERLRLDLSTGLAEVRLQPGGKFSQVAEAIARVGYPPHAVAAESADRLRVLENRRFLIRLGVAGMGAGNIMLLAIALYAGADGGLATLFRWASLALAAPVLSYSAWPFYRGAWGSLRSGRVSIDVPIALGLLIGTGASLAGLALGSPHIYFDSLTSLVFLLLSTRYLLRKMTQKALGAARIRRFLEPAFARKIQADGSLAQTRVEALRPGDLIRVLPGDCIPADGVVLKGESAVDVSLLTGESLPVEMGPGLEVRAGTWNRQAPLDVRVVASGPASRLGRILEELESGKLHPAPLVTLLDRVGGAFVLATLFLSVLGFWLGWQLSPEEAVSRALAVALVVCPCTFALATPLSVSLALARAARGGFLIKDAEVLERLSQVRSVVFDKTGTLTQGKPKVTGMVGNLSPEQASAFLALESRSGHPLAEAIVKFLEGRVSKGPRPEVTGFSEIGGQGVQGRVQGVLYRAGKSPEAFGDASQASGTRVSLWSGEERPEQLTPLAELTLEDELREEAPATVAALRALELEIRLLSGDGAGPVQAVARACGIRPEDARSGMSPEEKARALRQESGALMVGDGANDALALSQAFASVAVKGGMEASVRAAGVFATQPGLKGLPGLLIVARETWRVIRRNLVLAVLYNVLAVWVALTGRLDPLFAAVLMPASAATLILSAALGTRSLRAAFPAGAPRAALAAAEGGSA